MVTVYRGVLDKARDSVPRRIAYMRLTDTPQPSACSTKY
jgi:hypothetical protein